MAFTETSPAPTASGRCVPLCVDLDGTLLATDLLQESVVRYCRDNPLRILRVLVWLLGGRARLKARLAERVALAPETLPWRRDVVDLLRREKAQGRSLYLATAADARQAAQVTRHLGLFEEVFGSDGATNLKGRRKAAFLCGKFGAKGFDYIGDARADFSVWAESAGGMVVGPVGWMDAARKANPNLQMLRVRAAMSFAGLFRLARVHQWAKNLIVFVPVVTSHHVLDWRIMALTSLAFAAFCCTASVVYIGNDLLDLEHDRLHHRKHRRPLASGEVTIARGIQAMGVLAAVAVGFALGVTAWFQVTLALYVALNAAYSLYFKRTVLADAIVLACCYTIRLLAGHAATGIAFSIWLLAFAVFIFFSLALAKRFAELRQLSLSDGGLRMRGRGYHADDLPALLTLGTSSGITSVLVLVLYISSAEVRALYGHPLILLLLAPAFLYWIGRVWILAQRGTLHEDPVLFALKDVQSYVVVAFAFVVMLIAALWK